MKSIEITQPGDIGRTFQLVPETEDEIREFEEDRKWWAIHGCHCEEDTACHYVGDGERDDCRKHHWRCVKCGGIKQVG